MYKLWVIIKREYLSRVKKKSFLLTTLLVPILIAIFYGFIFYISVNGGGVTKQKTIAVVDESGQFENKMKNSKAVIFDYQSGSLEEVKASQKENGFDGILYIPNINIYKVNDNIKYYSDDKLGMLSKDFITDELRDRIKELRMEDKNIDQSVLESLTVDMQLQETNISESQQANTDTSEFLSGIGYIIGFALYFILIVFGTMVMRGVKEEKSNRIVEVIVSSVKPFQLMLGKIIGISFVGITQFLIWGVLFYGTYLILFPILLSKMNIDPAVLESQANSEAMQDIEGVERLILSLKDYQGYGKIGLAFLFYFLGGYFIYASLFSAVGSAVDDDTESQQLTFPVMMPILLSIAVLPTLFNDPNNPLAVWSSIFPLTSPIVMPARIPFNPPMWQIIASVISLIAGALFFVWLSAKIYRTGILMYGKKVNFKEIVKWLRY